jgi:hypothetical protein
LRRRTVAGRRRPVRFRVLSLLFGVWAVALCPPLSRAEQASPPVEREAFGLTFDCAGRTSEGRDAPPFASGAEAKFEVSATFGEGALVALVDPETGAVRRPLYDAESTSGRLRFSDGEETTIVWTRMSGADGVLVGEAIMGDGDVLALTIERGSEGGTERPFVLFSAEPTSLFRGACVAAGRR